jgi:hypothetical protein
VAALVHMAMRLSSHAVAAYFAMPSEARTVRCRMIALENNELERILNRAIVA